MPTHASHKVRRCRAGLCDSSDVVVGMAALRCRPIARTSAVGEFKSFRPSGEGFRTPTRRPSHFSLLAQRKVTQRNGLVSTSGQRACAITLCRQGSLLTESLPPLCRDRSGATAREIKWQLEVAMTRAPLRAEPGDAQRAKPYPYLPRPTRARGIAAAAPLEWRPNRQSKVLPACNSIELHQAISLGYFSLGQQREVTRASAGGRKPAAGEPGREKTQPMSPAKGPERDVSNGILSGPRSAPP